MAVPEQTPYSEHTGNGVTKSFALNFDCESKDHLIVLVDEIEPPIATWSLSGGNVVFTTAPISGSKITIQRNTPFSRSVDYQSYNNSFRPQSVNGDFDRLWLKLQELGVADWLMKLYVDRLHQQQEAKIKDLKDYVDDRDDELRSYLMEEIRKQGVALDQLDDYYNYLMQRLAQIAVDKGWDASFVVDGTQTQAEINLYGGKKYDMPVGGYDVGQFVVLDNGDRVKSTTPNNTNDPNTDMTGWVRFGNTLDVDAIADMLAIPNPNNGVCVYVKSYYGGWAAESNYHSPRGGGWFIYNSDKSGVNDGVLVFNGWLRQLAGEYITPTMAGARGDGLTDERLACEKSIVAARNLNKNWLVPKGETYLLNSYANYSEIASFTAGVLPIFSGVKYVIDGVLKVGAYFDDRAFLVFTDVNGITPQDWTPVEGWSICGSGEIDFSLSGKRRTVFNSRIAIYLETSYHSKIKDIKIHSGDLPNAIVTGGNDIEISGVKFIDLMQDNSANDDHSTIYAKASNTVVKNCYFEMNSINGALNACPVELHNSDSTFRDSVIFGYRNTHILAIITTEFPEVENLEVTGLKAKVYRNFANLDVWTGTTLINAQVHNNQCQILPFPTDAQISAAGLNPLYVDAPQAMLHVTNDSAGGYDLVPGIGVNINYFDNIYVSFDDVNVPNELRAAVYFHKAPVSGISVFDNTIRAKNILASSPALASTDKLKLDRFMIKDNDFDELFFVSDNLVNLSVQSVQSSVFSFKFNHQFSCNNLVTMNVVDTTNSIGNTFMVDNANSRFIVNCFNVTQAVMENSTNKIKYPATINVYFGGNESNFLKANVRTARIIDRGSLPDSVGFSEFIANNGDTKLVALCLNPSSLFGTYSARLQLEN